MIALILIAIIATDIAVAVLFLAVRRHLAGPSPGELDAALAAEAEELAAALRAQADQAAAELRRQRLHLQQMLAGLERQATAALSPITRREVMELVADGLSFRAIAARTGLSVEEVRLMVAMEEDARRAA